jgi:HEAT repeat protein
LAEIKPTTAERILGLVTELKSDGRMRGAAATKLGEMGTDARVALADLLAEIKKPMPKADTPANTAYDISERMAIVTAFVKIAGPKEALPKVAELLDKHQFPLLEPELVTLYLTLETDRKRVVALLSTSLARGISEAKVQPPGVIQLQAPSSGRTFPEQLLAALADQGGDAASAVPALLKVFDRADESTKTQIAATLGKIGPPAKEALAFLNKLLQAPDSNLRQAAAQAIEAIMKKQ